MSVPQIKPSQLHFFSFTIHLLQPYKWSLSFLSPMTIQLLNRPSKSNCHNSVLFTNGMPAVANFRQFHELFDDHFKAIEGDH